MAAPGISTGTRMAAPAVRARTDLFGPRAHEYGDWLEANAVSLQQFTAPEFADGLRHCTHSGLDPTAGHAFRMMRLGSEVRDKDVHDEDEQSEPDEVDQRNSKKARSKGPAFSLQARRERAAKARYAFSPAKEIKRSRGYFTPVATAAEDSKKSADEGEDYNAGCEASAATSAKSAGK